MITQFLLIVLYFLIPMPIPPVFEIVEILREI